MGESAQRFICHLLRNSATFILNRVSAFANTRFMKPNQTTKLLVSLLLALPVFFGCIKDECRQERKYTYYTPVYKLKDEVLANIKSNPARPINNPGKIYIRGNYIFLNEVDRGIHIIDNSNPASPRNIAFIDIPGNMDIAVKGNTMYADMYTDLVTLDITQPTQVVIKKITEGIFPVRWYNNGFHPVNNMVIADWVKHDTVYRSSCDAPNFLSWNADVFFANAAPGSSAASSPFGAGGSMARFAIMNERLYTVTNSDLDVFNISNPNDPQRGNRVQLGWDIETIYPFRNNLFIGSRTGMHIYHVGDPDLPVRTGSFMHAMNCDPVVADDRYAYVTLRSGTTCRGGDINQLDVVDIANMSNPSLVKTYPLSNPHGLSKDGNLLFVCDGAAGLKVYNAADVKNLSLISQYDIDTYDVIAYNGVALLTGKDGLYQFSYTSAGNISMISKIPVNR